MPVIRKFKLVLEYDGSEFSGWQTQSPNFRTIQSHLEDNLQKIFKSKIHAHASGRTDSGVHAEGQVVHFKVETDIKPELIHKALNAFLDKDLSVVDVSEAPLSFHAQNSVKAKTYCYTILNRPNPSALWRKRAYYYPHPLDIRRMRKAAGFIKGTHDFKSFQSASEGAKRLRTTVRTVSRLSIAKQGDLIHITITADGFLYRMVRNIVGALIAVGSKKIEPKDLLHLLEAKERIAAPKTAPSWGLCLMSVRY